MRSPVSAWIGLSLAGVLGGHWLGYVLLVPEAAERDGLLQSTGHGYVGLAALLSIACALWAMGAAIRRGYRRPGRERSWSAGVVFAGLLSIQTATFVAIEVLERVVAASGFEGMAVFVAVGAVLQVVTAAAGALLVLAARGVGEYAGRIASPRPRPDRTLRLPRGRSVLFPRSLAPAATRARAPPTAVVH